MSHVYQIGDADNEAENISPDEEVEKPDGNKTNCSEKNDVRESEEPDEKPEETSTKVEQAKREERCLSVITRFYFNNIILIESLPILNCNLSCL